MRASSSSPYPHNARVFAGGLNSAPALLRIQYTSMQKFALIVVIACLVFGLAIGTTFLSRRDQMLARQQAVAAAWAHVDAALQRRADLVPGLLASLRHASQPHAGVVAELQQLQDSAHSVHAPQQRIAVNAQLDMAIAHVVALVDRDPELRFDNNFFRIQEELAVAQRRVVFERRRYDQALADYNAFIADFPDTYFARWSGYRPLESYFASPSLSASAAVMGSTGQ